MNNISKKILADLRFPYRFCILMLLSLALSACWNTGASKRSNQFEETIDQYRILIRWGEFERAQNYIQKRHGEIRPFDIEFYNKIRVTGYEIIDEIAFGKEIEDPREIHIVTSLEFLHGDKISVRTIRYEQVWWYDTVAEQWFLDSDLPDFKSEITY